MFFMHLVSCPKSLRYVPQSLLRYILHVLVEVEAVLKPWTSNSSFLQIMKHVTYCVSGWLPFQHSQSPYNRYKNKEEEQSYWRAIEGARRRLQASNAWNAPESLPLVVYYTPKLLPAYRDTAVDSDAEEEYISPKTFCKWHRMVFPHRVSADFSAMRW